MSLFKYKVNVPQQQNKDNRMKLPVNLGYLFATSFSLAELSFLRELCPVVFPTREYLLAPEKRLSFI